VVQRLGCFGNTLQLQSSLKTVLLMRWPLQLLWPPQLLLL
jgi:hypothetical protein